MTNPQWRNNPGRGPSTIWAQNYAGTGSGEAFLHYQGRAQQNRDEQPQQQQNPPLELNWRPPTPEQKRARHRLRWLLAINLLLVLPFVATLDWWVQGTRYVSPPLFVLVLILGFWGSNQVIKHRLRKNYRI